MEISIDTGSHLAAFGNGPDGERGAALPSPFSPPPFSLSRNPLLKQRADILPQFRHVESTAKVLNVFFDVRNVETSLGCNDASNVFKILGTMGHRFHDNQIFRRRHRNADPTMAFRFGFTCRELLKGQTSLIYVDGYA